MQEESEKNVSPGKRLQSARVSLGLTRKDLSDRWGMDDNYIYMLEAGRRDFPLKLLAKVQELERDVRNLLEPQTVREDPAPYITAEPSSAEVSAWKERALTAEKKLSHIASLLASVIDLAKSERPEPRPGPPEKIPGVSSAEVSAAARALAASAAAKVSQASSRKREAVEPSVKRPEPKTGVEKG